MAKFQFQLETLRKIRKAHRDEVRAKLADAYQAVQILEEQQQAVLGEIEATQQQQRTAKQTGTTDLNGLLEGQRYQNVLRAQLSTLQEQGKQLEAEVEKRRMVVVEADRAVRVLDRLEERKRDQYEQERQRRELKTLDETAVQRFGTDQPWQA